MTDILTQLRQAAEMQGNLHDMRIHPCEHCDGEYMPISSLPYTPSPWICNKCGRRVSRDCVPTVVHSLDSLTQNHVFDLAARSLPLAEAVAEIDRLRAVVARLKCYDHYQQNGGGADAGRYLQEAVESARKIEVP